MNSDSWQELSLEKKREVLYWAKNGLKRQIESAIALQVHGAMVRDMQDSAPFDPTLLYDRINPRTKAHWGHAEKYIEVIEEEIRKIECEIAEEIEEYSPDTRDTPEIVPPKKAKKKKKKKSPQYPNPKGGCGNGRK